MAGQSEMTATLVQEREELMISSQSPATPILRLANFLTPSHNSINGSAFRSPPKPVPSPDLDIQESHVIFNLQRHWKNPTTEWKEWVDLMYSKHQTLWRKVGIIEAVLNSKYTINRDEELLLAFAERWSSDTNTFVLPWGEATITLEDMSRFGGYSVLGGPVYSPLDTPQKKIEGKLEQERLELVRSKSKKASHTAWLGKFMNSGNEIEHEAFLVYWLSRFVFPQASDSIVKCVFPIAIHLAKGTKIALAPAVLAGIYSDLSAFRKAVHDFLSERLVGSKYDEQKAPGFLFSSPFTLIQIWVWERFPLLQPKPKDVTPEEPYFAKWQGLKRNGGGVVTIVTDEVADSFIWRPYVTIFESFSRIKGGNEECVSVTTSNMDEEMEALIRSCEEAEALIKCLRVSELVGIESNCIEQYLPHRVARQFCLDQDIPGLVERVNLDQKVAWGNYIRPMEDISGCIPSHLYEPNVTLRYLEWWKKPVSAQ